MSFTALYPASLIETRLKYGSTSNRVSTHTGLFVMSVVTRLQIGRVTSLRAKRITQIQTRMTYSRLPLRATGNLVLIVQNSESEFAPGFDSSLLASELGTRPSIVFSRILYTKGLI